MARELTSALLAEAARTTLEDAAFVFADADAAVDDAAPPLEGSVIEAVVDYAGPSVGRVMLAVPSELAQEMAANLLGVDPTDDRARAGAGDALGEVLNIMTGLLLDSLFGPGALYRIGPPIVARVASAEAHARTLDAARCRAGLVTEERQRLVVAALASP
jgi:CheY-specific phosphatase CheX